MLAADDCPKSAELARFQTGHADDERIDAIGRHLETCAACQAQLAHEQPSDPLADGLRRHAHDTSFKTEPGYRRVAELAGRWSSDTTLAAPRERPRLQAAPEGSSDLGRLRHYRVLRELGEGAMGVVYEAEDTRLRRLVALKVLKPHWASTESAKQRFLLEARASANLHGEQIVPIYDVGEEDGAPFLAMALLRGETLESWLRTNSPAPVAVLLDFVRQIAQGLAVAHASGLVHRDLKPANLWLEEPAHDVSSSSILRAVPTPPPPPDSGERPAASLPPRVKILDFGLARCVHEDARITQSGIIVGTPAYMAPEQASGAEVDPRCDLFSLGCIAYRMAVGQVPFHGKDTLAVFWALASKDPTPPARLNPAIPPALSALIMSLLAKDPAKRPASAEALLAQLAQLPTRPRRAGRVALAGVALVAALCLSAGVWFWPAPDPPGPVDSPPVKPAPPLAPRGGLVFDGKAVVELPDFDFPMQGPYTLEAYATVAHHTPNRQVLFGAGKDSRNACIEISTFRQPQPTWRFSWQFPFATGTAPVVLQQCCHVAAVFSGGVATLYVDGKASGSVASANFKPNNDALDMRLGHDFHGTIHQFRLSKHPRYTRDFDPPPAFDADDDTLLLYRFDEGAGDVLHDHSGHARHARVVSAKWAER